jgi:SAM-dependent methyltransferase
MSDDEFAPFAEIYDAWVATLPVAARHVPFYVDEFIKAAGPCVELGVGNGRITIEAARRGVDITGVDVSPAMLALCRERAVAAGVGDKVKLIESDMRAFRLPAPAAMIAVPFSTVGHCVSLDDKATLFRHAFSQLRPGGLFAFDSLVFDPEYAAKHADVPHLRAETRDEATGDDVVLWVAPTYDHPKQGIRIVAWSDRVAPDGNVKARRYCRMNFSWITPEQTRRLLEDAGFRIEGAFGHFDRRPLDATSKLQIWFARKA